MSAMDIGLVLTFLLFVLSLVNVFVCYKAYRETENAHWATIKAKEESAITADVIATNRAAFEERLAALFSSSARSVDSATRRCSSSETLTDSAIERNTGSSDSVLGSAISDERYSCVSENGLKASLPTSNADSGAGSNNSRIDANGLSPLSESPSLSPMNPPKEYRQDHSTETNR